MGHWSIYDVDDGTNPLDEIWGDQEADRVGDYLEYLSSYEPARLYDKEALLDDIEVMVWDILYELEEGRKATRDEVEYGLKFSEESSLRGRPNTEPADGSSAIPVLKDYLEYFPEYFAYLKETDPKRLEDKDVLLNDTRVLTWGLFKELRNRPAKKDELEYVLEYCLGSLI